MTEAQILLAEYLRELKFTGIEFEYQFFAERKWKADIKASRDGFDYLWELDGGIWKGGHKRGKSLEDDYMRSNIATLGGFRLMRFTNEQVLGKKAEALKFLRRWFRGDSGE